MAGLRKYVEWMSRGRRTDRVAYVLKEWDLPEPLPGAEWQQDVKFNPAEEVLANPDLRDVFREAIANGAALISDESVPSSLALSCPIGSHMNTLIVFFSCPQCSAIYRTTQQRLDKRDIGSFACRNCGGVVHSWSEEYAYTGFRLFDPDTGRAAGE
jgi:predicted RNA-binding Zn-ribbon protein involved in translation (DUF1610 family)